jgi:asparagine synthase (glutamine-hydrolysing)
LWNQIVIEVNGLPENSIDDFGLYEFSEFKNRQTKYVITVQRVYEFFGYQWRLPLWDKEYLDYWENIQITHKINRNLFVEVMYDLDWGGVWSLKLPSPYITPKWISMVRVMIKSLFVFIGRDNWKRFDKKVFYYWTEILCKIGVVSYSKVLLDTRGYRNAISWLTEEYLHRIQTGDRSKNSIADE